MARQNFTDDSRRPGFQSFRQQGMVGIGKDAGRDVPCGVPFLSVNVNQQTHQLCNCDGRVGVVQLNADFVRQVAEVVALFQKTADNVLNGTGNKEILLNETELFA